MPVSYRLIGLNKELAAIIVAKMIEAGAEVFDSFPDSATDYAMQVKRSNEFVLVKNENPTQSSQYATNQFFIWHKPTLHLFLMFDGSRQDRINEYEKLIKMGIEIWSEGKWNEYRKALEQNDNLSRWSEMW